MLAIHEYFHWDPLAKIMTALVLFIGTCVAIFASRYLKGDTGYKRFFVGLGLLMISVITMACANHLFVLLLFWVISDLLLVKTMVHKKAWPAASASGRLAFKTFLIGFAAIFLAFGLFYREFHTLNIAHISMHASQSLSISFALVLLTIGAMTQSGIWPFHRWLTSSLNSPTPISAMMHAGLVNGGGFLLARFAPLYLQNPVILNFIFIAGVSTAIIGTLWKLVQSDIKRMLACSTMAQMGFMFAQAGLGLFSAAVAHLCWHGMLKSYLFLSSGNTVQDRRWDLDLNLKIHTFLLAAVCGLAGSYGFSIASDKTWGTIDTTLVLILVAFISGTQFAIAVLREDRVFKRFPFVLILTLIIGFIYGSNVYLIEDLLTESNVTQSQPLNIIYTVGMVVLFSSWALFLTFRNINDKNNISNWKLYGYVKLLNGSQPHPDTVTADRNTYKII